MTLFVCKDTLYITKRYLNETIVVDIFCSMSRASLFPLFNSNVFLFLIVIDILCRDNKAEGL
jgi:hypothetical protein